MQWCRFVVEGQSLFGQDSEDTQCSFQHVIIMRIKFNLDLYQQLCQINIVFLISESISTCINELYLPELSGAHKYLIIQMLNLQKNYLQKYQQIYPENAEWNTIQYKLQLNLGNASVELKRVYSVANPYLSSQFQKQNKGHIVSEVYIKPESLIGSNRIERVCQKGFQFNNIQNGMIFNMGQIQGIVPGDKLEYELLVVKICPKRSFPLIANEQTLSEEYRIPDGFDSLCFRDAEEDNEVYRHRFRINSKNQTLPFYIIQFAFTNTHQEKFKKVVCQSCQDVVATHYCLTEKTYFCKKCDFEHHKDKISSKHQRKPLSEKPILNFGFCKDHKQAKNQLFCRECNESMCISCKIYGTHSDGPMAAHSLQKIADYFAEISTKINQMDPNLQKRKDQLEQLLSQVGKRVLQINKRTSQIQNDLTAMFQQALKQLQVISRSKLSYLISEQLQIRRQYDYIQWMESFLKYEFNVLPPNSFLASWTKHLKLRKEILNISNIPPITDMKPNFSIYGKLRVVENYKINKLQAESENKKYYQTPMNNDPKNASSTRQKAMTIAETTEKEDDKQSRSQFRQKLFTPKVQTG